VALDFSSPSAPRSPWQALLPGALLVAVGFQVLHELIVTFLVPELEKSTSLYGGLGATTTLIFFIYLIGLLIVTGAVLNSSSDRERRRRRGQAQDDGTTGPTKASSG
jgi:uncharacterized BrkB/YihY/UPF0761 family membrane protein